MKQLTLVIVAALLTILAVDACPKAKADVVGGTYTIYLPSSYSADLAKSAAEEQARLLALADRYGSIVYGTTSLATISTTRGNDRAEGQSKLSTYTSTDVKGEWIADTTSPVTRRTFDEERNSWIVEVTVSGTARAIFRAAVEFEAKLLRNSADARNQTQEFNEGDDLYLSFKTPVDGYLAVYMLTEQGEAVCMLPYAAEKRGSVRVVSGYNYLFFSMEAFAGDKLRQYYEVVPDEYTLGCNGDMEHDRIIILFSPKEFNRAIATLDEGLQQLSADDFDRWLSRRIAYDPEMQIQKIGIGIRSNKFPKAA